MPNRNKSYKSYDEYDAYDAYTPDRFQNRSSSGKTGTTVRPVPRKVTKSASAAATGKGTQKSRSTKQKKQSSAGGWIGVLLLTVLVLFLAVTVLPEVSHRTDAIPAVQSEKPGKKTEVSKPEPVAESDPTAPTEEIPPEEELIPEPVVVEYDFNPHCVDSTMPENMIDSIRIEVDGQELADVTAYENAYGTISFGAGSEYAQLDGVLTFRGNNYRDDPTFGETGTLSAQKLVKGWEVTTSVLNDYWGNQWSGNGWTGQSLIVRWPKETRQVMTSMQEWARNQEDLVEVITASMDGRVYFTELTTGKATRNSLNMGMTYKGGGALDPRGYPILYLGGGLRNADGRSNISVVNLLDNTVMYTFGMNDPFQERNWPCFDSSPLVSAETDQLIYPAENGLVYIIHLNTQFDEENGTLSINPDNVVKWRYHNSRNTQNATNLKGEFFSGIESSAAVYGSCAFLAENGGALMCLDLNTLQLVWVQDILDDSNCSPVIAIEEDGHPYVYVSTSFHYGWRSTSTAEIPIWKIDAETGEIVWSVSYTCMTADGVSGGVEGTLAIDDTSVYVPFAKVEDSLKGRLVCIDKKTGTVNWERQTNLYSWASPIRFDDASGKKYVLYNNGYGGEGYLYLLDATTGEIVDSMNLGGTSEASGVLFENTLVIPTRACRIFGVNLT